MQITRQESSGGLLVKFTFRHHIKTCPLVADLCVPLTFTSFELLTLSLIYLPLCALRYVSSILYNSYRILYVKVRNRHGLKIIDERTKLKA